MEKELSAQESIKDLVPQMNVAAPPEVIEEKPECLIEDQALLGVYDEIMGNLRQDRLDIDTVFNEFWEMVANQGDASSASKEAVVNLLKIKTDTADKMSRVADLMTRIKLKSPDTYKPYLTAKQNNNTTINITENKRELLKKIEAAAKQKKEDKDGQ